MTGRTPRREQTRRKKGEKNPRPKGVPGRDGPPPQGPGKKGPRARRQGQKRHQRQRPCQPQAHLAQFAKTARGQSRRVRCPLADGFSRRCWRLTRQNWTFQPRRIPFHARVFDGGERPGQFHVEVFLRPRFFVNRLDFAQRLAHIRQRLGHLLGIAARGEFGFFEQAQTAGELLDNFIATGVKFTLSAAEFFQAGALPVFLLAQKHLDSPRAAVNFAIAYLVYPVIQSGAFSGVFTDQTGATSTLAFDLTLANFLDFNGVRFAAELAEL